ncbi:MAG: hypothetical protein JKY95_08335, partial [Planctomycetaceae bacterium]|nr:hypothetical protein [Planctomycetaceae bacterium]
QSDADGWSHLDISKFISPQITFDESQVLLAEVHSVADLVVPISQADADKLGIEVPPVVTLETLAEDIEKIFLTMLPYSWLEEELLKKHQKPLKPSYESTGKSGQSAVVRLDHEKLRLIIRAPHSVHDEIHMQFSAYRKGGRCQLTTELRFIEVSSRIEDSMGIEWNDQASDARWCKSLPKETTETVLEVSSQSEEVNSIPVRSAVLSNKQVFKVIQKAQKDERSNILFAPKSTSINGTKVALNDHDQRAFVTGVSWSKTGKLEPEIKLVTEGLETTFRTTLEEDQSTIHIQGIYDLSRIEDVRTFTSDFQGKKTSIQVPRIALNSIRFEADLKETQTLLIEYCPVDEKRDRVYLMFTPYRTKSKK